MVSKVSSEVGGIGYVTHDFNKTLSLTSTGCGIKTKPVVCQLLSKPVKMKMTQNQSPWTCRACGNKSEIRNFMRISGKLLRLPFLLLFLLLEREHLVGHEI